MNENPYLQPGMFVPESYLEHVYPEDFDVKELTDLLKAVRARFGLEGAEFDLSGVEAYQRISSFVLENAAVMAYQIEVACRLLQQFPDGDFTVLDVGGGPTIYQHIALSLVARNIYHSDLLVTNRLEVVKWNCGHEQAHNWDNYFRMMKEALKEDAAFQGLVAALDLDDNEIKRRKMTIEAVLGVDGIGSLKEQVRNSLRKVIYADVFQEGLGTTPPLSEVDVVTSHFSLEAVSADREKWRLAMKNSCDMVSPGGFMVMSVCRNSSYFEIAGGRIDTLALNEDDFQEALADNGFSILDMRVLEGTDEEEVTYDGMFFIFAQKE